MDSRLIWLVCVGLLCAEAKPTKQNTNNESTGSSIDESTSAAQTTNKEESQQNHKNVVIDNKEDAPNGAVDIEIEEIIDVPLKPDVTPEELAPFYINNNEQEVLNPIIDLEQMMAPNAAAITPLVGLEEIMLPESPASNPLVGLPEISVPQRLPLTPLVGLEEISVPQRLPLTPLVDLEEMMEPAAASSISAGFSLRKRNKKKQDARRRLGTRRVFRDPSLVKNYYYNPYYRYQPYYYNNYRPSSLHPC